MKKRLWRAAAGGIGIAALALVVAPGARADERLIVKVPFPFIVGTQRLPAGDYVIDEATDDASVVRVQRADGTANALTMTIAAPAPTDTNAAMDLTFAKLGNDYFLSGIDLPDARREIPLTPARMEQERVAIAKLAAK